MKRIIVIAFCIALICLPGCKRREVAVAPEETKRPVVSSTPTVEETVTTPAGEPRPVGVYSPDADSPEYAAIVAGISEYTRESGPFTVHQLQIDDDIAIADVELPPALTGWRALIALVRNGEEWIVAFDADAFDGTPDLSTSIFPAMSDELEAAVEWTRARETLEELARTHAIAEAASQGSFSRSDLRVFELRVARTATHEWWASCTIAHSSASVDPLTVYMRWTADGDGWETFDCGTGIEPSDDPRFPSDVADKL